MILETISRRGLNEEITHAFHTRRVYCEGALEDSPKFNSKMGLNLGE